MKFEFDRKYFKICLYAFLTLAALLLFNRILQASDNIWQSVKNTVSFLLELLSPFIIAIFIAYILSPAVSGIEKLLGKVFRRESHTRGRKLAALVIVYLAAVAIIAVTLSYVLPGLVRNIGDLIRNLPSYYDAVQAFYKDNILTYPLFAAEPVQKAINEQLQHFSGNLSGYMANTVTGITSFLVRLASSVASFVLGLVMSFYLLNEREVIVESFQRLLKARLGDRRGASVMGFLNAIDRVFGRYISARLLLCLIMFVMCFVVFTFLNLRYVVLMSAIVSLTTLVPYIGPFLGAIPPIFIALLDSPEKAIYVGISILVIHQVDNYFIEPHVFSDKMGLSPFWILLSIVLGGGLLGIWGLVLAVPIAAVIKLLIVRYIRGRQLRHRRAAQEAGANGSGGSEGQ